MDKTDKAPHLKKYRFKPGQSGNPEGRPKDTLKEFAKKYFQAMNTEEKTEFLNSLDPDIIWRMAEGNPAQALGGDPDKPFIVQMSQEIAYKNNVSSPNTEHSS